MVQPATLDPAPLPARLLRKVAKVGSVGFGAFSRIFALGSQFVVLVLLGRMLPKADFGDFMIAFALTRVLSQGLGTGLATLLVYHVSRNASVAREYALHRSAVALGAVTTGAITVALMLGAEAIAGWFDKPSLAFWIRWMAPFMLFSTLLTIGTGTFDGRGRITRSIVASEFVPNLIRLAALPLLLFLGFGNVAVVGVMLASVLVPWLVIAGQLLQHRAAGFAPLTRWDLGYSGKLTLHSFAAMQMQGIDMLMVGWLFSSTDAADYAIASRVAALIPFFQQIIVKGFMAKAGKAIHDGDNSALQGEVDRSRRLATLLVTGTAVAAMAVYPVLLAFLGGFQGSMGLLVVLAAGAVYRSYFPGADALIRVAGHADFSLRIMLTSVVTLVLLPLVAAPVLGTQAVAVSMLLSGVALNPVMERFIRRTLLIRLIERRAMLPMAIAAAGLAIAFAGAVQLPVWYAGVALLALSAGVAHLLGRRAA